MRVEFTNPSIAERAAKRLKTQCGVTASVARETTAVVLGYASWQELFAASKLAGKRLSALDEDLNPDELARRRSYQRARIQERFNKTAEEANRILAQWQPSAGRPQRNLDTIARWKPEEGDRRFAEIIEVVEKDASQFFDGLIDEPGQTLDGIFFEDEADEASLKDALVTACLKTQAEQLKQRALCMATYLLDCGPAFVRIGHAMLEALAVKDPSITVVLAADLAVRGGTVERRRSTSLLKYVIESPSSTSHAVALAHTILGRNMLLLSPCKEVQAEEGLKHLRKGAIAGEPEAMYLLGTLFDDDEEVGADSPFMADPAQAAYHYRQASYYRHEEATACLNALLYRHPLLAELGESVLDFAPYFADDGTGPGRVVH